METNFAGHFRGKGDKIPSTGFFGLPQQGVKRIGNRKGIFHDGVVVEDGR
jgi:hypothetical protein